MDTQAHERVAGMDNCTDLNSGGVAERVLWLHVCGSAAVRLARYAL